ncbi:hypothetical protein SARC_09377 [Sphaeroforma arctica JP610]|uniref:Uncharacterized protein n=1 Tax=Sphaeroforma arctica JP610 TaxID=667725 RepID=A0A0L0FNZ1_9EUKA|nr:hypothetical protein SARC_09377 [Sphaeroforma arctica JP610]KNC78181.1 hypothetical protein SARC_09377 [Sphaeroforma arctica JP610]|eukprot:XP_014152083.1 hypothetical protein SARC_09377 [Sphaeroforma arctica JP610]
MDLITAVEEKNLPAVVKLLDNGWDVDTTDQHGRSALVAAAATGCSDIVDVLLEYGATVDLTDKYRYSALMRAAHRGYFGIVRSLLDCGADTEIKCKAQGYTALMRAAHEGHANVVDLLIEREADVNATSTKSGVSALLRAAIKGHSAIVSALLEASADCNIASKGDYTPLLRAAEECHVDVVDLLLRKGNPDRCFSEFDHMHPIYLVENSRNNTKQAKTKTITALLDAGVKPHRNFQNADSCLLTVVADDNDELVEALLRQDDCDVDYANVDGETALIRAARLGRLTTVSLLLAAHANVDARDKFGDSPLICAANEGHTNVAKHLIEHEADVNAAAEHGHTALIVAAISGHFDIVQYLLDSGADIDSQTDDGFTALIEATKNGHAENVDLLIRRQCDPDLCTSSYRITWSTQSINDAFLFYSSDEESSDEVQGFLGEVDESSFSNGSQEYLCASSSFVDSDDSIRDKNESDRTHTHAQTRTHTQPNTTTTHTTLSTATNNPDTHTAKAAVDYDYAQYIAAHKYPTDESTPGVRVLRQAENTRIQALGGDLSLYVGQMRSKRVEKTTHITPNTHPSVCIGVDAWYDTGMKDTVPNTPSDARSVLNEPAKACVSGMADGTGASAILVSSGAQPTSASVFADEHSTSAPQSPSQEPLMCADNTDTSSDDASDDVSRDESEGIGHGRACAASGMCGDGATKGGSGGGKGGCLAEDDGLGTAADGDRVDCGENETENAGHGSGESGNGHESGAYAPKSGGVVDDRSGQYERTGNGVQGIETLSEAELLTLQRMLYGTEIYSANPGTTSTSQVSDIPSEHPDDRVTLPQASTTMRQSSLDSSGVSNETIGTSTTPSYPSSESM